KFVENLGVCDGFQAIIFHAPNQLLFPDPEYDDLADFPLIFLDSDIVKMPESIERFDIPADDVWVELVVWLRLKVVLDRVRRNPAIAGDTDFFAVPIHGTIPELPALHINLDFGQLLQIPLDESFRQRIFDIALNRST